MFNSEDDALSLDKDIIAKTNSDGVPAQQNEPVGAAATAADEETVPESGPDPAIPQGNIYGPQQSFLEKDRIFPYHKDKPEEEPFVYESLLGQEEEKSQEEDVEDFAPPSAAVSEARVVIEEMTQRLVEILDRQDRKIHDSQEYLRIALQKSAAAIEAVEMERDAAIQEQNNAIRAAAREAQNCAFLRERKLELEARLQDMEELKDELAKARAELNRLKKKKAGHSWFRGFRQSHKSDSEDSNTDTLL